MDRAILPRDADPLDGEHAVELSNGDARFLADLGSRVRALRERRGMSRKLLARESRVSERYLGQLEGGTGNISVMLLRRVACALGVGLGEMLARLASEFGDAEGARRERIALIGLRGAGKSTLGAMLADALHVPLIELNREVSRESGLPVAEVIALYGAAGYRRIERRVFERLARGRRRVVIVASGGIVHDEVAFDLLLANCHTIWIKARPEEHMARVLAQGDFRPMAGNDEAMQDLVRMLEAREPLYRRADDVVDTSGETPQRSFARLRALVAAAQR